MTERGRRFGKPFIPPGFPAPPSLLIRPVKFLDDCFFFELLATQRNLTLQSFATIDQLKSFGEFHAILVERFDNKLCTVPAGNTPRFDLADAYKPAFTKSKFLDDRSVKADE